MLKAIILFLFFLFASTSSVFAVRQIYITTDKSTISLDDEMLITASVSGFTNGEKIYIKGAFYKEDSSNYFGFTKLNNNWIKNSETVKSQREVAIGDWDNLVTVKLDYGDSGYKGIGDYKFKLGFYYLTSSGNASSVNWSTNLLDVSINNEPSPTSVPEAVVASSTDYSEAEEYDTPTPQSNDVSPVIKTGRISPKSVKITNVKKEASQYAQIKPIDEAQVDSKTDDAQVLGVTKESLMPKIYLVFGIFILAVAVFLILKRELKIRKIF